MRTSCQVIQDLIPSYIDQLLSDESHALVEEHLKICPSCQAYLESARMELPTPELRELKQDDLHLIKELQHRLKRTQWLFLLAGVVIAAFTLWTQNPFSALGILPFVGFVMYFFTQHPYTAPLLSALLLSLLFSFKDSLYNIGLKGYWSSLLSSLSGCVLWFVIFLILLMIGVGLGALCAQLGKQFKARSLLLKTGIVLLYICIGTGLLWLQSSVTGNPFTMVYARAKMNHYLSTQYPDYRFTVHEPEFNFKSGGYHADAYMYTGNESRKFNLGYNNGRVWSDYYSRYEEDFPTALRFAKHIRTVLEEDLLSSDFVVDSVDINLSVPKFKYDSLSLYDPTVVEEPVNIFCSKYVDMPESYTDFLSWCETLRLHILAYGYPLESVTFTSDPYFDVARLELTLKGDEIYQPITTLSSYNGFVDYNAINHFAELSEEKWLATRKGAYMKDSFINDYELSQTIDNLLKDVPLENVETTTALYDLGHSISLTYVGDYLSPDEFAEHVVAIREILLQSFNEPIYNLSILYYYGTSYESWHYDLYEERMDETKSDILRNLLTNEKLFSY